MPLPAPQPSVRVVTLKIDGLDLSAREDETIIEVCRENKIPIPSLCWMEGLSIVGACRMCMVEVTGQERLLAACSTRVIEGMDVQTNTEKFSATAAPWSNCCLPSVITSARSASPTAIASCNGWRNDAASTMCACPTATPATTWTAATRCSASTTTAACSAPAACASATRSRARTPGTSWAEAAVARSSPIWPTLGATATPAPVAASACRSVPPGPW
jgi:hypothetical protein